MEDTWATTGQNIKALILAEPTRLRHNMKDEANITEDPKPITCAVKTNCYIPWLKKSQHQERLTNSFSAHTSQTRHFLNQTSPNINMGSQSRKMI